ncbi:hypothetical protein ACFX1R_035344 [Malus domestica]
MSSSASSPSSRLPRSPAWPAHQSGLFRAANPTTSSGSTCAIVGGIANQTAIKEILEKDLGLDAIIQVTKVLFPLLEQKIGNYTYIRKVYLF